MNGVEQREDYRPESQPAPGPPPEGLQRVLPSYPAEIRRRKGFPYKSPLLASLLSLGPGLGQVYIGYYQRGFTHILITAVTITALSSGLGDLTPLFGVLLAFFWIYNVIKPVRLLIWFPVRLTTSTS